MTSKEIILRLGHFRNQANLSARELSLRIGKHEGYISKLESYDFNITIDMLTKILETLNISYPEFFADNYVSYAKNKQLYELIESLSEDKKDNLINFIKTLI